jgi:hypothetical protein
MREHVGETAAHHALAGSSPRINAETVPPRPVNRRHGNSDSTSAFGDFVRPFRPDAARDAENLAAAAGSFPQSRDVVAEDSVRHGEFRSKLLNDRE